MARKIFSGTLIALSALLLVLSVIGIGAVWFYNEPLTRDLVGRLKEIDNELSQAQTTLQSSEKELERTLHIVEAAQKALEKLAEQSSGAKSLLEGIQNSLDKRLLPELKMTRGRIESARAALEKLQSALAGVSRFIPNVDLSAPNAILKNLIDSANSLDTEIANVEALAQQASTFVSDTSYLLGGDLSETRDNLQNFLASVQAYEKKVANWREQVAGLIKGTPKWIDQASIILTIFLLWFALSQFGLFLHGLNIRRGNDPLEVLRSKK